MAREMKDSGIEWIGLIPDSWTYSKLKYIGKYINGYAFKPDDWSTKGKRIIRIQDLTGSNDNPNYYEGLIDDKYLVNDGDILVSWAATLEAFIWNKGEGWLNQHIFKALPNTEMINQLFFFWLINEAMKNMNNDNKHGIMMQHVTLDIFNNFTVPIPPIEEQQIIASFLDAECSRIDSVIEKTLSSIEEYKKLKQSVITEAVTKGIRPNRKMKDSGIEWAKQIPEEWNSINPKAMFSPRKEKAIGEEKQLTSSQNYGIIYQDEYMKRTGAKVVTVQKDFDILKHVEKGDFVISMRSFQGGLEYSNYTGSISSAYVMLIPNTDLVYPAFFKWLFKSSIYINALQSTSNMVRDGQAMRFANFIQVRLYSVPLDEQKEIADYLDKKIPQINSLISKKEQLITELETYKKSLIYEYVTGKKEVKDNISVEFSTEFKKALLMCRILELTQCKGRIHLQKTFFALDTLLNLFSTQYYRFEHGPYDLNIERYEKIIEEKGWLNIYGGKATRYNKTSTFSDYYSEYEKVFKDKDDIIQRICKVFNVPRTTKAEKIATLLAVWNDFLVNGIEPTDDMIIDDVMTNWTPNKANTARETWSEFLSKIRENNIVPKGYGKHTKRMEEINT